jgi:cyclophilin family peptidyl-prolyl cis-trans isomerase
VPSQAKRQRKKQGKAARAEAIRIAQQRERRRRSAVRTGAAIVVIVVIFALLANFTGGKKGATSTSTTTTGVTAPSPKPLAAGKTIASDTPCPKPDGTSERTTKFAKAPPNCLDEGKTYTATIETSEGNIVATLDTKQKDAVNYFVVLARYHYYDGSSFYRTDTSLQIIQGGVQAQLAQKTPGFALKDVATPFSYAADQLIFTRNDSPDSSGPDIFITTSADNPSLSAQGTYIVFGTIKTPDVPKKILDMNVGEGSLGGGPSRVVTIKTITISES